ncbi:hypothetical protein HG535_0A03130 [Zygotorulaspora mrakii]|uniref:Anoctamin transmembrane domain-containing protein n=1 Tax=Zygotorulaspora mrakii TaxID=42260 RepID=A0A7H9AWA6_ZYGMR|nr:uncharacterized protein HG535_0A03130 [Zygotorulaspora mrakii]QLG70374.1 hypothetical protein HG535_0A03130 [Zygotorulaspora mrakii]
MPETFDQLDPNYVITLEYTRDNLIQLTTELAVKGLHVLTRPGYDSNTLYAFTRVEDRGFHTNVKSPKSIRVTEQSGNEILYRVCQPLKFVKSITPIHDFETRQKLESFSSKLIKGSFKIPADDDLIKLSYLTKNPRESLYFAFFKTYIQWLWPISMVGVFFRLFSKNTPSSEFNIQYSMCVSIWSLLFAATWVFQNESKFSSKFGKVNGYFNYTGKQLSSPTTVLYKKLCFIPVACLFAATLIAYQLFCFFIEIFVTQFYQGPLKSVISLTPLVLLSIFVPFLTNFYNRFFVDKLVEWENGSDPNKSKVEKNFVLAFLTSYMPLIITLFFYLPMGYKITPELKDFIVERSSHYRIPVQATDFIVDVNRYKNQFFYFTVTNHIVVMLMEDIVPYLTDRFLSSITKKPKEDIKAKKLNSIMKSNYPSEFKLWNDINNFNKTAYGEFNVDDNYKKVIVQYGYITMFSTIWPLAPFCCLCFNYLIFKIDLWRALKRCKPSSCPNDLEVAKDSFTARSASAGPWNTILETLTWIGTITTPSLIVMYRYSDFPGVGLNTVLQKRDLWYRYSPLSVSWTTILVTAILSEHVALLAYFYLTRIFSASTQKFVYGFVPAVESQEPPKINLSSMIKETVGIMNLVAEAKLPTPSERSEHINEKDKQIEKVNGTSGFSQRQIKSTESLDESENTNYRKNGPNTDVSKTVDNSERLDNGAALPKGEIFASPEDALETDGIAANGKMDHMRLPFEGLKDDSMENHKGKSKEKSKESPKESSLNQVKTSNSNDEVLSTAGATLPETIPTSKNYHLRYDKYGNPIQSSNSTKTSKSSLVDDTVGSSENSEYASKPTEIQHDEKPKDLEHEEKPEKSEQNGVVGTVRSKKDEILTNREQDLAAAAASNAISNHSRTSSKINAVQQFSRDVPTSLVSGKSSQDQAHTSMKAVASLKSKAASSVEHDGHVAPRKKSSSSKRSSVDMSSKESKEHKHKHKMGLLRKLKKKL